MIAIKAMDRPCKCGACKTLASTSNAKTRIAERTLAAFDVSCYTRDMTGQNFFIWMLSGAMAYLLGSLPFGFLIARAKGVDIRTVGSGNMGATNVFRAVSKPLGLFTFALDFAKGVCGVLLVPLIAASITGNENTGMALRLWSGFCTVIGHNWTCFLGFKGGKGVATSAGMLLALSPVAVGIALVTWLVTFVTLRYVSLASIIAAGVLGIAVWPLHCGHEGVWFPAVLTLLAVLSIWKHRSNIARLRAGTESRFTFRKRLPS